MMRAVKKIAAAVLAVTISASSAFAITSFADEAWDRLMDDNLEYSEIQDLVHNFNPTIAAGWEAYDDNVKTLRNNLDVIKDAEKDVKEAQEKAGEMAPYYEPGLQTLASVKKTLNSTIKSLTKDGSSSSAQLRNGEKQLAQGVQSLMIAYKTISAQKEMLAGLVNMYQDTLNATNVMVTYGMATALDVASAQTNLLSAKANLSKLTESEYQIYNQLITMCGWKSGAVVCIGEIPAPDVSQIVSMNPTADYETARLCNTGIAAARKQGHAKTSTGREVYNLTITQMENNLRNNLTGLYNDVISARDNLATSQAGFAAAQETKAVADKSYSMGLMSKLQHQGAEIAYIQKKAAYETASMSLAQAINAYKAALEGNCSVD